MGKRFALITGASGGIGREIALKLAEENYSLYLHYNSNEEAILKLIEELKQYQVELIPIQADLAAADGYKKLAQNIFALHAIVLNSGNSYYGLISDMDEQIVNEMVQLHVTSPFQLSKELLPKLMYQEQAAIVAVTSIWGQTGASCEVLYSMVKGSQNAFIKALSKEVSLNGIRVNAVAPGAISTSMLESFSAEDLEIIKGDIPMGRMGSSKEVAEAVFYLLSDKASYITGQILGVNGGWYT
ncbi:elongation factor P 5-aminopentanone reductase [Peribacillus butanolivorans]|uniref:elongation factor P 5-aminopentanone reductase n=1 Tax=Peribacillus TaxID=2675229 RepID=UPI00191389DD|nr:MULTISPECIES: SDR family oxidoreductase [unclassified Peribacillus]MBK5459312.1 SDR family oxidoreductase [Peribacillus sp. TH27]MBK5481115.1 SDR family oxidoreductase [Peribacillus sp. TH16]MBK5497498.1 SDR family oxidoreductase [Peribacillus sp. TH14]MBK5445976.1 SDR family oxidoreductase [Peribacillus sp. TH24]WMX57362.1 SDR family oxidoreductase [Peribacillus sp. R9-11]